MLITKSIAQSKVTVEIEKSCDIFSTVLNQTRNYWLSLSDFYKKYLELNPHNQKAKYQF